MGEDFIYFDHNATTPVLKEVKESMLEVLEFPMNPSSIHSFGRQGKRYIEKARNIVSDFLNVGKEFNVIFTGSGTESNNLALRGTSMKEVITSEVEHVSVLNVIGSGKIPVDGNGIVNFQAIRNLLENSSTNVLVSVMLANNETGVIQPIKEIANLVHKYDGILHVDAVQAPGKMHLDVEGLGADMVTISAHKFGGPIGAAALIAKKKINLKPLIIGGGQEYRMRSGTQNVAAIYGFATACIKASEEIVKSDVRDYLEEEIEKVCSDVVFFGKGADRLPNTTSIGMPAMSAEAQVIHFDMNRIFVSAGSACSSGTTSLPHVQMAMGYQQNIASTAIRISLGKDNTKEEAGKFIIAWKKLYLKSKGN